MTIKKNIFNLLIIMMLPSCFYNKIELQPAKRIDRSGATPSLLSVSVSSSQNQVTLTGVGMNRITSVVIKGTNIPDTRLEILATPVPTTSTLTLKVSELVPIVPSGSYQMAIQTNHPNAPSLTYQMQIPEYYDFDEFSELVANNSFKILGPTVTLTGGAFNPFQQHMRLSATTEVADDATIKCYQIYGSTDGIDFEYQSGPAISNPICVTSLDDFQVASSVSDGSSYYVAVRGMDDQGRLGPFSNALAVTYREFADLSSGETFSPTGLTSAYDVYVDDNGLVYSPDFGNDRFIRFDPNDVAGTLTTFGNTSCDGPTSIVPDGAGLFWATCFNTQSVISFSTDVSLYASTYTEYTGLGFSPYSVFYDTVSDRAFVAGETYKKMVYFTPSNYPASLTKKIQPFARMYDFEKDSYRGTNYIYSVGTNHSSFFTSYPLRFLPGNSDPASTIEDLDCLTSSCGINSTLITPYVYSVSFDQFGSMYFLQTGSKITRLKLETTPPEVSSFNGLAASSAGSKIYIKGNYIWYANRGTSLVRYPFRSDSFVSF